MQVPEEYVLDATQSATDSGTDNFFRGGHCGQCLELLSHLCQYGESILLVSGPIGIGKSTIKQALIASMSEQFVFCEIQATADLEPNSLLEQIESGLDTNFDSIKPKQLVLLIEDAQNVSVDIMNNLFQLKQKVNATGRLRVVLFALPEFEQNLHNSTLKDQFIQEIQVIEVEPLTLNETEAFLRHLWNTSGKTDKLPLDEAAIKKIYSSSNGVPGQAKQLAQAIFEGKEINKSTDGRSRLSPFAVGLTVTFGLIFCLLAFLWPTSDDNIVMQPQPLEHLAVATNGTIDNLAQHDEVPVAAEAVENYTSVQPVETENLEPTLQAAEAGRVQQAVTLEEKMARLEDKLLAMQDRLAQEQEARRSAEMKLQVVLQKPQRKEKELSKVNLAYSKEEKHILSMPSKNYTLQILGASNEQMIKDFIKTNNLSAKAHYFKSTYQGKPWFIVIYGNYPTRAAANIAANELSPTVRKLQPWPREFAYVQRTIKKK